MKYKKDRTFLILNHGVYKNIPYWIISYGTHPCSYLDVTNVSKEKLETLCVHGDITYDKDHLVNVWDEAFDGFKSNVRHFIGWDYCHLGDYEEFSYIFNEKSHKWTTEELYREVIDAIDQLSLTEEQQSKKINVYPKVKIKMKYNKKIEQAFQKRKEENCCSLPILDEPERKLYSEEEIKELDPFQYEIWNLFCILEHYNLDIIKELDLSYCFDYIDPLVYSEDPLEDIYGKFLTYGMKWKDFEIKFKRLSWVTFKNKFHKFFDYHPIEHMKYDALVSYRGRTVSEFYSHKIAEKAILEIIQRIKNFQDEFDKKIKFTEKL